jgi:cytochrome c-type biogenesis protein CcmF
MIGTLGHLAILLALAGALLGAAASFAGGRLGDLQLIAVGRRAAFGVLALVTAATGLMLIALVTHDFSVKYVADVGSRETPLYYTIISLWGALEGSILFWAFLLSLYTAVFLLTTRAFPRLLPYAVGVLLTVAAFFLFVIAGPGDPFAPVSPVPADGAGPNALLQNNWMMGVHPPLLYLGYVGLAVPYAIAMASLLRDGPEADVLRLIRRWALIPWIFLSLGIVAGMWWSYAVLGWGGYWSWDPVENASVMPWLVTTAFLHSLQVQERRRMLKTWTLSLVIAAFLLSILGTFLTRSGVLASVHSFTQSGIGPVFLGFFAAVLVLSLGLLFARSKELAAPGALDAVVCRESAFLFNNLLLVAITFTILLGTMFPLVVEAAQGAQLTVGAPYFNHVGVPIGFALLFLMGVGPVLPWGASRLEDLQYHLLGPVMAGVTVILLLVLVGVRGVGALVTFGIAAFVLAVTLGRFLTDVRVRQGNTHERWLPAAWHLFSANPRRYGGYVVHLGVLLAVIGIAASQAYQIHRISSLAPGQSMTVDGYTVTYRAFRPHGESNRMVLGALVSASRAGQSLGSYTPSLNVYPGQQTPVVTPAVREEPLDMVTGVPGGRSPLPDLAQLLQGRNPFEDLYLVLQDANGSVKHPANTSVTLEVFVNPMVGFIWLGGGVMGLGGFLALLPAIRRRRVEVPAPELVRVPVEEPAL